jgi:predicted pyridoxine 5'-phosphate oxidase superfamily flavin-nucleotide-binding protein
MAGPEEDGDSPWHAGELAAQQRVGSVEQARKAGATIRPFLTGQQRAFFPLLPFLLVGSVDAEGWPWASLLTGAPGFVSSPDPRRLQVGCRPFPGDPLSEVLAVDIPLGLLGIDLETRRRNRVNGRVASLEDGGFTLAVDRAFGNCPRYIRRRRWQQRSSASPPAVEPFRCLDEAARQLISGAETCFLASFAANEPPGKNGTGNGGADLSHRGGPAGFIAIGDDGVLIIPDFAGNGYFNSLGNLLVNPRAGLLFPDFTRGDLLHLAGTVEILWEAPQIPGAERLWRFSPRHGRWLRNAFAPTLDCAEEMPLR